jgi:hypothetical protein
VALRSGCSCATGTLLEFWPSATWAYEVEVCCWDSRNVLWRRSVIKHSCSRTYKWRFHTTAIHVEFVLDTVVLGQDLLGVVGFFPVITNPIMLYTLTFLSPPRWHSGYGTALQIGRSLVRFQVVSLEFFIDIILPIALWPWVRLSL